MSTRKNCLREVSLEAEHCPQCEQTDRGGTRGDIGEVQSILKDWLYWVCVVVVFVVTLSFFNDVNPAAFCVSCIIAMLGGFFLRMSFAFVRTLLG
jgi:hypothetical protein